MKKLLPRVPELLLMLPLLLAGCAHQSRETARAPQQGEVQAFRSGNYRQIRIGLCEDYPEESRSLALARRDLHVLATNNIRVLRIAFGWDAIEPEPGKFDWTFWDDFVRMATTEHGITLIPYVCYTPGWAASQPGEDAWRSPPKEPATFGRFMKEIVARYKGKINSWELWNEPDNQHYWLGTAADFAELLRHGSAAVREADPEAKVVLGGLAWDLNFLRDLAEAGALENVDIVNLHNYYETWSDDPLERLPDYVGRACDILRREKIHQPLWMAELGYSSYRSNGWVSAQYQARAESEHTPGYQAASLFRAMTLLLASGQVELAAWYRINDLPAVQDVIGDVNNRHLGVLDVRGSPKEALSALTFFNRLFERGYRSIGDEVHLTKSLSSRAEVHAFETPAHRVLVLWLPARTPGDLCSEISNPQSERIAVELPVEGASQANLHDETGMHLRELRPDRVAGDRIRFTLEARLEQVSVILLNKR